MNVQNHYSLSSLKPLGVSNVPQVLNFLEILRIFEEKKTKYYFLRKKLLHSKIRKSGLRLTVLLRMFEQLAALADIRRLHFGGLLARCLFNATRTFQCFKLWELVLKNILCKKKFKGSNFDTHAFSKTLSLPCTIGTGGIHLMVKKLYPGILLN